MSTIEQMRAQLRTQLEQLQARAYTAGSLSDPRALDDIIASIQTDSAEILLAVAQMLDGKPAHPWEWWRRAGHP